MEDLAFKKLNLTLTNRYLLNSFNDNKANMIGVKNFLHLLNPYYLKYGRFSFSQEGEDLILLRLLNDRNKGFYIDIGAHHPYRFSNTHIFYSRGWKGINVEPNPVLIKSFYRHRKRDINLNIGVADSHKILDYYMFNEPALNTFSESQMNEYLLQKEYYLTSKIKVTVKPLSTIINEYLTNKINIDFISIDTEGNDLIVLRSNDWDRYRPNLLIMESQAFNLEDINQSVLIKYMNDIGYELISKLYYSLVFRDNIP